MRRALRSGCILAGLAGSAAAHADGDVLLSAARGGTLGLPTLGPVQGVRVDAAADLQIIDLGANAFAKLDGIPLGDHLTVTIGAELADTQMARVQHRSDTSTDEAGLEKLETASLRLCLHGDGSAVTLGARALRRASLDDYGQASLGVAFELMYAWRGDGLAMFGGGAYANLRAARDTQDANTVDFPGLSVVRLSLGAEYQWSEPVFESSVLPRVGAYAIAELPTTSSPASFPGDGRSGTQIEAGVYSRAWFGTNLQIQVALRYVRQFQGPDVLLLSLMPTLSSG